MFTGRKWHLVFIVCCWITYKIHHSIHMKELLLHDYFLTVRKWLNFCPVHCHVQIHWRKWQCGFNLSRRRRERRRGEAFVTLMLIVVSWMHFEIMNKFLSNVFTLAMWCNVWTFLTFSIISFIVVCCYVTSAFSPPPRQINIVDCCYLNI